jgi:hypothetical protein
LCEFKIIWRLYSHDIWRFPIAICGFSRKDTVERVAPIVGHQSPMKSRFAVFLCVIAVFQLMGGHWAVLQAAAWVGMLVKYSESEVWKSGSAKPLMGNILATSVSVLPKTSRLKRSKARRLTPPKYTWSPTPSVGCCCLPATLGV